jgi:hypothetical protein
MSRRLIKMFPTLWIISNQRKKQPQEEKAAEGGGWVGRIDFLESGLDPCPSKVSRTPSQLVSLSLRILDTFYGDFYSNWRIL